MVEKRFILQFLLLNVLLTAVIGPGYSDLEWTTRKAEDLFMKEVMTHLKRFNYTIKAFYHVSGWQPYWKDVVSQQLKILDGQEPFDVTNGSNILLPPIKYSILNIADELHITAAGLDDHYDQDFQDIEECVLNQSISNMQKISIHRSRTMQRGSFDNANESHKHTLAQFSKDNNITEGEVSTIQALHSYCSAKKKNNEKAFVLYFHSKGGCCPPSHENKGRVNWRNKMNMYTLEFPSLCLRALHYGYPTCGTDLFVRNWASTHYQGNFWWANCDYIAALPAMHDPFKWLECEFFIFNVSLQPYAREYFGQRCGFHVSNFGRLRGEQEGDHYSRNDYLTHISQTYFSSKTGEDHNLLDTQVLRNHPPGKTMDKQWIRDKCKSSWQEPYMTQHSWTMGNAWWRV